LQNPRRRLGAAALLVLCLYHPALPLSQLAITDAEKTGVVRAVLEAEQERQRGAFASVNRLSTENIASSIPAGLAADFKLSILGRDEIRERAKNFIGVTYLAFKEFEIGRERATVKLTVTREVTPCFGPYQKRQEEFTYRLEKMKGEWKAKVVGSPFGAKPDDGMHPTAGTTPVKFL
jgi:hypothetical protein